MRKNTCLIDIDQNIVKNEVEKVSRYKYIEIEAFKMWGNKIKTILLTIGTLDKIKIYMNKKCTSYN